MWFVLKDDVTGGRHVPAARDVGAARIVRMPPAVSSRVVLAVFAVVLCSLVAVPAGIAVATSHEHLARILVFSALTIVLALGGLALLLRRGLVPATPATQFDVRVLIFVLALSVPWAAVIVDAEHASYFLIALIALSLWLLPSGVGTAVALALTGFAIVGQVFHHGFSAGAVVGPLLAALVMAAMMGMYRRMSSLNLELLEAQEQLVVSEREAGRLAERSRLGRDIHDTVAQSLSSITMLVSLARTSEDARDENLALAQDAAAQALAETRAFISELTPPELKNSTLVNAIERSVARIERESPTGTVFTVSVQGEARALPTAIEASLIKMVQASARNVSVHAHASHCEVRVRYGTDAIEVDIDDDGRGFAVEDVWDQPASSRGGFGLRLLRERAQDLGGFAAVVSSTTDGGTLVSITIPLPASHRIAAEVEERSEA